MADESAQDRPREDRIGAAGDPVGAAEPSRGSLVDRIAEAVRPPPEPTFDGAEPPVEGLVSPAPSERREPDGVRRPSADGDGDDAGPEEEFRTSAVAGELEIDLTRRLGQLVSELTTESREDAPGAEPRSARYPGTSGRRLPLDDLLRCVRRALSSH